MTFVAPRIGNDVSYVTRIKPASHSCVAGAVVGEGQVSLCVVGAILGEVQVSLCVVGAVLGEVQVSLCVVGAVLGEVQVSLFVAGAVLGEVQVSLFVVGAVLGEIWKDSRSAKCLVFFNTKRSSPGARKVNLCYAWRVCGLTETVSEHSRSMSRILIGSAAHWK